MFTRKSLQLIEYSRKNSNVEVDLDTINEPAHALILAVSNESGVVAWKVYKKSVNVTKFLDYIELLHQQTLGRNVCIFWDNLAVHRSRTVCRRLDELGIRYIFNIPASPDFNGVEGCFSKVKQTFKTLRLQKIAKGIKPNVATLI